MSAPDGSDKPRLPAFLEENWEPGNTEIIIEEDTMRVIIELLPRVEGAESTTFEMFSKPF